MFKSLNAVTATGVGGQVEFVWPRINHTMQVILGGTLAATGVIVGLEGTLAVDANGDPTGWRTLGTWDLAAPLVSGDIVSVSSAAAKFVRANLTTLTGGTAPTVSAEIVSSFPAQ
jgi:hypothetical protein